MGLRQLEAAVLRELRGVTKEDSLRLRDIQEWSTGVIKQREQERVYFLPELKVYCAVLKSRVA